MWDAEVLCCWILWVRCLHKGFRLQLRRPTCTAGALRLSSCITSSPPLSMWMDQQAADQLAYLVMDVAKF